jgi:tRNA pseudouridine55 synthase
MELIHPLPKVYEADITWGVETDTCDHLGQIVSEGEMCSVTEESLNATLDSFLGWSEQVPPATSAKKIDGEPAYKKAHRGEAVEMKSSPVYLHDAAWISHELPIQGQLQHRADKPEHWQSRLRITCRGGFYVRSLARDLGRMLGCGAHLSGLHRTKIGPWADPSENNQVIVRGMDLIPWCRRRILNEAEANNLACGRPIDIGIVTDGGYTLPANFPETNAPIAAILQSKVVSLLKEREGQLWTTANLRGGL